MNEHLRLLLRLHDGDDRCGCLRKALEYALARRPESVIEQVVEQCLTSHPAGSRYRA